MDFSHFSIFGKPVCSCSGQLWRERLALVRRFPGNTKKKLVVRMALIISVFFFIDRIFNKFMFRRSSRDNDILASIDSFIRSYPEFTDARFVVIWPQDNARKRVHVHLYDKFMSQTAFGKFTIEVGREASIINESVALATLNGVAFKSFFVPVLIACREYKYGTGLLMSSLPKDSILKHPRDYKFPLCVVKEYQAELVQVGVYSLIEEAWWGSFADSISENCPLYIYIQNSLDQSIRIGRVHGDFGSENIYALHGDYWIIDWESSSQRAPYCVDELAYWIGGKYKFVINDTHNAVRRLLAEYKNFYCTPSRLELMCSLAFLHGTGFHLASKIINVMQQDHLGFSQ